MEIQREDNSGENHDSFVIGERFEIFVCNKYFPKGMYDLVYHTPSHEQTYRRYIASARLPDFLFRNNKTKAYFWVEAKFRTPKPNGEFDITLKSPGLYDHFFLNYSKLGYPFYYLIGCGGDSSNPDKLFLLPDNQVKPLMSIHELEDIKDRDYIWLPDWR